MPNNLEIFKKQISIYYQPIWSPAKQAVIAFRCYPKRRTPNGVLHGPSVLYEGADDPWAVHLDMIMVDAVKGILLDPQRYGSVARLSLPIHYGSVAGENGLKINSALQSLPPSMLRKRTMLEIIGNPADRSEALMKQATRFALNYGGHVSFELAPDDIHVDILEESHVKMLQYEVPAADPFVKDQSHLLEIRRRGKMLAKAGIAGRIHNLNMLAQVQAARQSGYSLLAGRAIGHSEETPSQPYPLTEAKILGI